MANFEVVGGCEHFIFYLDAIVGYQTHTMKPATCSLISILTMMPPHFSAFANDANDQLSFPFYR
jgi:hypothetical protein